MGKINNECGEKSQLIQNYRLKFPTTKRYKNVVCASFSYYYYMYEEYMRQAHTHKKYIRIWFRILSNEKLRNNSHFFVFSSSNLVSVFYFSSS